MGNAEVRPHWKNLENCSLCREELNFWSRHHCRNCGSTFCANCSNYEIVVPLYRNEKKRVCKDCFHHLEVCQNEVKKNSSKGFMDYELQALIGTGKFGKVVKAKERASGKIVAIKIIKKKDVLDGDEVQHTIAERNILMRINHPFLMRLHSAFQTAEKLVLVMDFVNGGELFYHLVNHPSRKFDNDRTKFYAAEICLGIEHLHSMGVIYRDLKPENVLIDGEGHIRLTDFGLSKEGLFKNDRTSTFCGTPEYLAPEVLLGTKYSNAVDWWGFGALIFEMLTGTAPFFETDVKKMFHLKITGKISFPDYVEDQAKHLLIRLLDRNPGTRLTDPKRIKSHPWFSTIEWEKLYKKEVEPPFRPVMDSPDSLIFIDKSFTNKDVNQEIGPTNEPGIEDNVDPKFSTFNYFPDSPSSFSDKTLVHRDNSPPTIALRRTSSSVNFNQDAKRRISYFREMVSKDSLFPPLKMEDDIVF